MSNQAFRKHLGDALAAIVLAAYSCFAVVALWHQWKFLVGVVFFIALTLFAFNTARSLRTGEDRPQANLHARVQRLDAALSSFSGWVRVVPLLTILGTLYYLTVTTFGDGRPFQ